MVGQVALGPREGYRFVAVFQNEREQFVAVGRVLIGRLFETQMLGVLERLERVEIADNDRLESESDHAIGPRVRSVDHVCGRAPIAQTLISYVLTSQHSKHTIV